MVFVVLTVAKCVFNISVCFLWCMSVCIIKTGGISLFIKKKNVQNGNTPGAHFCFE